MKIVKVNHVFSKSLNTSKLNIFTQTKTGLNTNNTIDSGEGCFNNDIKLSTIKFQNTNYNLSSNLNSLRLIVETKNSSTIKDNNISLKNTGFLKKQKIKDLMPGKKFIGKIKLYKFIKHDVLIDFLNDKKQINRSSLNNTGERNALLANSILDINTPKNPHLKVQNIEINNLKMGTFSQKLNLINNYKIPIPNNNYHSSDIKLTLKI